MPGGLIGAVEALLAANHCGSLRFYGEWFGGRPYENQHTLADAKCDENTLVLTFDDRETLTVRDPDGVTVTEDGVRVANASAVRWEWFYYGRPQTPENLYVIEYVVANDGTIIVNDTTDWHEPNHRADPSADAVALLSPPAAV